MRCWTKCSSFYKKTLKKDWAVEHIPFPKKEKRLPEVLSVEEVSKLFLCVRTAKSRTILQTMYGAGLRSMEALSLRPSDIDSSRMVIHVRQSKGRQDRYVTLSASLLETLREYYRDYRPEGEWLFPNRDCTGRTDPTSIQRACRNAARKAGLVKRAATHTMRHYSDLRTMPSDVGCHPRSIGIAGHSGDGPPQSLGIVL